MKQKRLIEKTLAVCLLVVMVFSSLNVNIANAATQAHPGTGNPVVADQPVTPTAKISRKEFANIQPDQDIRVIVQLKDPALTRYDGSVKGLSATSNAVTGAKQLNVETAASKAYTTYLVRQQSAFNGKMKSAIPHAQVDRQYQVALNAVAVRVKGADIDKLTAMPEVVHVSLDKEYKLQMDSSIPQVGLGTGTLGGADWVDSGLWKAVGGHQLAGKGIKIADIDSGITPDNPCFDPTGYRSPVGFPRGERWITNGKIIAAYSYFRPDDPPVYPPSALDDPASAEGGHGTHTAGTMACNYGTVTPFSGVAISGVAPKAQLMIYRVFYESVSGSHSAYTAELVAAIEQAIKDGADVVNNSWGGTATDMYDAETLAFDNAVAAGMVVVFSAGNEGPQPKSIGSPGVGDQFITVGATTTSRTFKTTVDVVSRSDGVAINPVADPVGLSGRSLIQSPVTAQIVDLQLAGYPDTGACPVADGGSGPLPSNLVDGKIVMIVREGACALVDKVANAAAGGAVGVILRNINATQTLPLIQPVIPTAHIAFADATRLKNWLAALPAGVTATVTIHGPAVVDPLGDAPDTLASFSSVGPNMDLSIKPDLSAPGVNILSSVSALDYQGTPTFDFYQGTSMAAPHVTGAAALLHQLHPTWKPAQVKSALMTTTDEPASLPADPTQRGSGRLSLASPDKVAATLNPASLSYRLMTVGDLKSITVGLANVTSPAVSVTYNITVADTSGTGNLPVVTDASDTVITSVVVPAGGSTAVKVALTAATSGDSFGTVTFTPAAGQTPTLHMPYFARVVDELGAADIFLVNDDLASSDGCVSYLSKYTTLLDTLGLSYVTWDVGDAGYYIDFDQARKYKYTLLFTGECGNDLSFHANEARSFLATGGKMIVTGSDAMAWDYVLTSYGYSVDPGLLFGASFVQNDLFATTPPAISMVGNKTPGTFLYGQFFNLDGLLQDDEMNLVDYSDMDTIPLLSAAPIATNLGEGLLGTARYSEPTIERVKQPLKRSEPKPAPWTRFSGRAIMLSFDLNQIVSTGPSVSTSGELLTRLLQWLDDEVIVGIDTGSTPGIVYGTPSVAQKLNAFASGSYMDGAKGYQNMILQYRWDFGDGSPVQTTYTATVTHKYPRVGAYKVLVEATDGFGHRAVSDATVKMIKMPGTPVTLIPANTNTSTPKLMWNPVGGATQYLVEVYSVASGKTVFSQTVPPSSCVGKICPLRTTALAYGTYKFKVRASIYGVWGPFSGYRQFKVTAK